jgi:hypothetical protein
MSIYHLWLARNDAHDKMRIEDPNKIARRYVAILEECSMLKKPAPNHHLKDA